MSPLAALINTAILIRVRNVISTQVNDPAATITKRTSALETPKSIDAKLSKYRQPWADRLPVGSPAREINFPLLHVLVRRFNYADKEIITDISRWMPIAGDIPTCPSLTPRGKAASESLDVWMKNIAPRNKRAIDRVERFRKTELGAECWAMSAREISDGWLSQPVPLTDALAESTNLTHRLAIFEQPGDGPRKVRIIDDLKASGANAITTLRDTSTPDSLDVLLATAAYYRLISPGCDILAASADFCHAYKNIGVCAEQEAFAAVLLGPPSGPLQVSHLQTQPFGSSRAPGNWDRVTKLTQWILMTYFGTYLPIFADGCFLAELAETMPSAYLCVDTVIRMCGFDLDKAKTPSRCLDL